MRKAIFLSFLCLSSAAQAQTVAPAQTVSDDAIKYEVPIHPRAKIQFRLEDTLSRVDRNRYAIPPPKESLYRDSCAVAREWSVVTPLHDCSHRGLKRGRPMIRFIYVF